MNGYALKAYLKYRKQAKGRHDVHSPFVFDFVENVLRGKQKASSNFILGIKQSNFLINRIAQYFDCRQFLWLSNNHSEELSFIGLQQMENNKASVVSKQCSWDHLKTFPTIDLVLLDINDPQEWQPTFEKLFPFISPNTIVIIPSIHQSEWHTQNWEQIAQQPTVKLSFDLFRIGLLFFREEFLVKQHFVLK